MELKEVNEIIARHSRDKGALIEVLRDVQSHYGYLPHEALEEISSGLGNTLAEIYSVATFYSFFTLKPKGRHTINICKGTACYVKGSDSTIERLCKELRIKPGDTTDDGLFSLKVVRCLGGCGLGPVMMVDDDTYTRVKPDRVMGILDRYRNQ